MNDKEDSDNMIYRKPASVSMFAVYSNRSCAVCGKVQNGVFKAGDLVRNYTELAEFTGLAIVYFDRLSYVNESNYIATKCKGNYIPIAESPALLETLHTDTPINVITFMAPEELSVFKADAYYTDVDSLRIQSDKQEDL